jgi:hypothetical protein
MPVIKMKYTPEELDNAAISDLLRDAEQAAMQAENGPYFPEKDITAESLIAYSEKCLAAVSKYRNGEAHKAVLMGRI